MNTALDALGRKIPHGHRGSRTGRRSPTYHSWQSMVARCVRKGRKDYSRYGGRGVTVCDRWRSFPSFLTDMGQRPPGTTLDRIDNSKGYEPGNCRWATSEQQNNNRSDNRRVVFGGECLTVAQWARRFGLSRHVLKNRLRLGWPMERAVTEPVLTYRPRSTGGR